MKKINARVSPPAHRSKKPYLVRIIAKSPLIGQSQRCRKLAEAINKGELTSSLEILAQKDIESDLALFIVANIQISEVLE
ncbi:hypothetical protein H6G96_37470 [Nostoc sp. FACHB-892]|uniref:hypothetical protein n=1 Tax=Nostoc sp. FACHB-892 TaxID=2692843 RepID=UPI0016868216|nr:hypothetical protein [Nostoc sp. FACHB-892]MBD2731815.1 hypothetical protein [Nostoc sp. FACHB-892]